MNSLFKKIKGLTEIVEWELYTFKKKHGLIQPFIPNELEEKLPGSTWGITVFFNPSRYKSNINNLNYCLPIIRKQGLRVICIEILFNNNLPEVSKEMADKVIYFNAKSVLWHKEALINKGLEYLPSDCDKVIWFDADIIFENSKWLQETNELLEKYIAVQPFEKVIRLPKFKKEFKWNINSISINEIKSCNQTLLETTYGIAKAISQNGITALKKSSRYFGQSTGGAWAYRRKVLDKILLYDEDIIGGGDGINAHAYFGTHSVKKEKYYTDKMRKRIQTWKLRAYNSVQGSVGFANGDVYHLWHGEIKNRKYKERKIIWKQFKFDPSLDIQKDKNGVWQWSTNKIKLHNWVHDYFISRREDG